MFWRVIRFDLVRRSWKVPPDNGILALNVFFRYGERIEKSRVVFSVNLRTSG
jgi:hypothetical protein